ncbi:glycogen/starch synthase, ADP-glucose type [Granulicella mallensis MP5ACTX8]|uniref:Glycogen/starch synthase, ADP-glucose type n=1 Tax=Granulicella mallensis (strain ATCC BAA-1857 / DSM 23137 / MP5ACTX8) TaxID=682795 RepID=G8NTY8_GRAMM|nr:glycogen/starch synthase, ADP-glucose type [Granulicella mallensis MP5ACTX8]
MTSKDSHARLEPIQEYSLLPIRRSNELTGCSLYWIPVSDVPVYGIISRTSFEETLEMITETAQKV